MNNYDKNLMKDIVEKRGDLKGYIETEDLFLDRMKNGDYDKAYLKPQDYWLKSQKRIEVFFMDLMEQFIVEKPVFTENEVDEITYGELKVLFKKGFDKGTKRCVKKYYKLYTGKN